MILMEMSSVPSLALPLAEFKLHLCLGTGFDEDSLQDELLETCLRAAISTIEGHCGKILLQKQFMWQVTRWASATSQILPARPVKAIDAITLHHRSGEAIDYDCSLMKLGVTPFGLAMIPKSGSLPVIPTEGAIDVIFTAGFGTIWTDIPSDISQAVLVLATSYYENRSGQDPMHGLPPLVRSLLAPHKHVRLGLTS